MRKHFFLRPTEHGLTTDAATLIQSPTHAAWPTRNVVVDQRSIQKRWGYTEDRDLGSGVYVHDISLFSEKDGTQNTMFLTETDLCRRESSTFSYKTETYTTDTIDDITTKVVTKNAGTTWVGNVAVGDKFILDDDHSATAEEDANWGTIASVDGANQITLAANYSGTTGSGLGKDYKVRKVYTTPTNEHWSWAIVDDTFCFGNGDINVQAWSGSGYASALHATYAIKARYMIEFANRLVLADYGTTRDPLGIIWSAEGDPSTWTGNTAGSAQLLQTGDFITGLGRVGANIIVYKTDTIIIGIQTGVSTAPIAFPTVRRGVGLIAPYSLVEFLGTNAWIGRDDFYVIDGDYPRPLDEKDMMREKFFDLVSDTEIERTVGWHNYLNNTINWVANTSEGRLGFSYNYKLGEWGVHDYADSITCAGRGES